MKSAEATHSGELCQFWACWTVVHAERLAMPGDVDECREPATPTRRRLRRIRPIWHRQRYACYLAASDVGVDVHHPRRHRDVSREAAFMAGSRLPEWATARGRRRGLTTWSLIHGSIRERSTKAARDYVSTVRAQLRSELSRHGETVKNMRSHQELARRISPEELRRNWPHADLDEALRE